MRSLRLYESSARMRQIKILLNVLLALTAAAPCSGEGSIGYISLSMNGVVTVANRSVAAIVCTVGHNSSHVSTFFYLNGTKLTTSNALQMDGSLRVQYYEECYQPPSQGQCEELSLLIRVNPQLNNTRISCRTRAQNSTDKSSHTSPEEVTIIVGDPEVPETPSCSSPTDAVPSSTSTALPSAVPTPTPEPSPDIPSINMSENKSPSVLPEGKERIYVLALASETVVLICAVCFIIFLVILLCKKMRRRKEFNSVPSGRSVSPEATEVRQLDEKTLSHHPTSTSSAKERSQGVEPRYTEVSLV